MFQSVSNLKVSFWYKDCIFFNLYFLHGAIKLKEIRLRSLHAKFIHRERSIIISIKYFETLRRLLTRHTKPTDKSRIFLYSDNTVFVCILKIEKKSASILSFKDAAW